MVKFDRHKLTIFIKINLFNLLIDFFDILIDLFDLYINLLIEFRLKNIDFYIEIVIVDSIWSLDFESDRNQQTNLDFRFDSTTMIWFATPNRISLF